LSKFTLKNKKLSTISNITLLLLYLVCSVLLVLLVNSSLKNQALSNAERYAALILDRNLVTHAYFNNILKTSLFDLSKERLAETAWMETTFALNSVSKEYGLFSEEDISYRETAINARNPASEADAFERDFIKRSNANPSLKKDSSIREISGEPVFVILQQGQKNSAQCLRCHGNPEDAPAMVIERYGDQRGFNRRTGEIVSALSIRIPLSIAYQEADVLSLKLSAVLLVMLLVIFCIHGVVSRQLIFAPISVLQKEAKGIAENPDKLGDTLALPFGCELSNLVQAFNRMSQNLRQHNLSQEETIQTRTAELSGLQHRKEMIINTASEGILGLDASGEITLCNRSAAAMLGYAPQTLQESGLKIDDFLIRERQKPQHPDAKELVKGVLGRGTEVLQQEATLRHHDGRAFPVEFSCAPILDETSLLDESRGAGAVFSFNDITRRKSSEREIQNLAYYDQLTGLPNRTLFYDRIHQGVATALRDEQKLALMFLDLDDFKIVNDTLGHAAGDNFLKEIARRLMEVSRQADTVARLGGDEFVWFGEVDDMADARLVALKFLESISMPVQLGAHTLKSTVSIGIVLFPQSATDVIGLMKCADSAMYQAKHASKNAFCFFGDEGE